MYDFLPCIRCGRGFIDRAPRKFYCGECRANGVEVVRNDDEWRARIWGGGELRVKYPAAPIEPVRFEAEDLRELVADAMFGWLMGAD